MWRKWQLEEIGPAPDPRSVLTFPPCRPKFVFFERDDNLAFCAILHVLSLAFADGAFLSEWIRTPEDFQTFKVPSYLEAVPIEWKQDWLDKPILRRSWKTGQGWVTSPDLPLQADWLNHETLELGRHVGFKEPFRPYVGRRGAGEAINKTATVAERNQAMGQMRSDIFDKYYVNQITGSDHQAAFLGIPSRDALMRLAGHMSLSRDPRVMSALRKGPSPNVSGDPHLQKLQAHVRAMRVDIKGEFGLIKKAPKPTVEAYKEAQRELYRVEKRLRRKKFDQRFKEYWTDLGCREIDRQRRGLEEDYVEEKPSFPFPERGTLASLMCRNEGYDESKQGEIQCSRNEALRSLISLCPRETPQSYCTRRSRDSGEGKAESEEAADWKWDGSSREELQCPWCLANERRPLESRRMEYASKASLLRHIQQQHLTPTKAQPDVDYTCPFTSCDAWNDHEQGLKSHLHLVHSLKFRER